MSVVKGIVAGTVRGANSPISLNAETWFNTKRSTITRDGSNLVSNVTNLIPGGNDAVQATGASQPTYIADSLGFPAIQSISNDFLATTIDGTVGMFWIVFSVDTAVNSASSSTTPWRTNTSNTSLLFGSSTGTLTDEIVNLLYVDGTANRDAWTSNSSSISTGSLHSLILNRNAAQNRYDIYFDGQNVYNASSNTTTLITGQTDIRWPVSLDGKYYETGHRPSALTDDEVTQLLNYIREEWGI